MVKTENGAGLYKRADEKQVSVGKICDLSINDIWLVDNGDGHTITRAHPQNLLRSEFAECLVETIMPNPSGCIVLWLPRKEED